MKFYARFFERRRGWVLAFVVLVTAAATLGLRRLKFDDVPRGIFVTEEKSFHHLLELYEQFGSDDNDAILVLEKDDWLTREGASVLRDAARSYRAVEGVESFFGLTDVPVLSDGLPRLLVPEESADEARFQVFREEAPNHPLVGGRLLSKDGTTTIAMVRLAGEALSVTEMKPIVQALREIAEDLSGLPGVRARVTGVPPVRVDIYETIQREQVEFLLIGAVLCSALAWFLFRSLAAVLAATTGPILGTYWAFGMIGLFGGTVDLLAATLPLICIVIGFTDSVHLVTHARDRRAEGVSPLASAVSAIRELGGPCFLTSLTTAVGFGSLAVGNVLSIRRFGTLAAVAVLCSFAAVVTTMPLVASKFQRIGSNRRAGSSPWPERLGVVVDRITARPVITSVVGVALTIWLLSLSAKLVPENRLMEATVPGTDAYTAMSHCEEVFGGVLPAYVLMEWDASLDASDPELVEVLGKVEALVDELIAEPTNGGSGVAPATSALSLLKLLPGEPSTLEPLAVFPDEAVRRFVREDLSRLAITFGVADGGTETMDRIYGHMRDGLTALEEEHTGISFFLTGTDVVARHSINTMIVDLAKSLFFAAIVIVLVIAFEFRSFSMGVVSLIPNLFPLAVVASFLALRGDPLQLSSAVVFSVLLGLAVDDTIHFLSRYRRELDRIGARDFEAVRISLRRSFVAVGRAVAITTLVLFLGFAVGLTSEIPLNQLVSGLLCVGIVAALVGDLLILPGLLALRAVRRH